MSISYECAGCGCRVFNVTRYEPPDDGLCAVCGWVAEVPDPARRERLRKILMEPSRGQQAAE